MRRWLSILLLLIPAASVAQVMIITAVTAQIKDTNGSIYSNCQWSVSFVGQNPAPVGPYQPQNLTIGQQGTCDSFGNLNVALADNINTIFPTPSQWQFNICSAAGYLGGPFCFTTLQTITGNSMNLTSVFTPLAPKLPTSGGGGGGGSGCTVPCIVTLPTSSQNVVQPPGTQFSSSDISNIVYAETSFNWSQVPSSTLTGGSAATVTLSPCPAGIWGNDTIGVLYVSGVGTPEPVHLTGGGSCTPGAGSGTITFTPVNSHSAGYTIGSGSSGIYEAIASQAHFAGAAGNISVVLKPSGTQAGNTTLAYAVQATIAIPVNNLYIEGEGAVLICTTRDYCLAAHRGPSGFGPMHVRGLRFASTTNINGWSIASTQCASNVVTITTTATHSILVGDTVDVHDTDNSFYWGGSASQNATVSTVTGTTVSWPQNCGGSDISLATTPGTINVINAAVLADNMGDDLTNVVFSNPGGVVGHFNNDIVVLNDQEFNLTRSTGSNINNSSSDCSSANPYCGAFLYAPGPFANASVMHLNQDDISLNCGGNGVMAFNGNTLSIKDTVVQGYAQTGILGGTIRGGFGPTVISNVYTEGSGACGNPNYSGAIAMNAGLNQYGSAAIWDGGEGAPSTIQTAFGTGGANNFYYYVIAHDSAVGATIPLLFGSGATATTQSVQWPRIVSISGGTITYDIVRQISTVNAPTTANCVGGSVTACGSVATGLAQCVGLICSFTDDVTLSTSAITILAAPTFAPRMTFWPFNFLQGGAVFISRGMPNGINEGSWVSTSGSSVPTLFGPIRGLGGSGNVPIWALSDGALTSATFNTAYILNDAGTTTGLKGRINISRPASSAVQGQVITLIDSDPVTTLAHGPKRPAATSTDAWFGNDATSSDLTQNILGIGGGQGINFHIGTVPGASNWVEKMTSSVHTFTEPIVGNSSLIVLGSGCTFGCSPFLPSGTQVSGFGTGSNFTAINGTMTFSSGTVSWATDGTGGESAQSYTASSFNASHFSQAKVATVGGGINNFVCVHASNVAATIPKYCYGGGGGSFGIFKVTNVGAYNSLVSASSIAANDIILLQATQNGTTSVTLTAFQNGTQVAQTTDSSSPILGGFPGISFQHGGSENSFQAGDLTQSTIYPLTFTTQLTSTLANGTAPLLVSSTTPVANLTTVPTTYNHSGTQQTATHLVQDSCVLGTSCAVTLTGSAVYTSATSYTCVCQDDTAIASCNVAQSSGSAFTITGTGTDTIRYVCAGN